ncbi:MAG: polysaccharide deacetylase family protein [Isosphaeraceae bacterium]
MNPTKFLRAVPNKREFVARTLGCLGALDVLERTTATWKPGLTVVTYHRIAEPAANPFYDPVISATPDSFRAQINWLCNRTRILTLDELIDRAQDGSLGHEPTVLVTFDDGYRDNFDVAVPILAERNVPATFFIPTAFFETPHLPWWDEIAYVIKRTQISRFTLQRSLAERACPLEIDLEMMARNTAIITIIRAVLDDTIDDTRRFLDQLAARAEVAVDAESLGRSLFMNWDQLRRLAESGAEFTIGSHSHSHSNLARLDVDSQRRELTESKQILETRVGREIKAFAYPYGWPGTFTSGTKAIVAEAGYRLAFASREGVTRAGSFDPLEISRFGVGSGDSAVLLRARIVLHAAFGKSFL